MMFKAKSTLLAGLVGTLIAGSGLSPDAPAVHASAASAGQTYYVSSSGGNDAHAGTDPDYPWKTLSKVSSVTFGPGDKILLKGGDLWEGEDLILHGSGTETQPIEIGSYGTGRAHIRSTDRPALHLKNESGWIIAGLELEIVSTESLTAGSWTPAMRISFDDGRLHRHIRIADNLIYGSGVDFATEGIVVSASIPTGWERELVSDLTIEGNTIHDVGWRGINVAGWDPWRSAGVFTSSIFHNVKIHRNTVYNTGNQGIVLENANRSSMKWNVVSNGGQYAGTGVTWGPGGIWPIKSSHIDVKFNEVYGMSDSNSNVDGAGLNLDWTCEFCTLQYNYAHDNKGAGITSMANRYSRILDNKVESNDAATNAPGQITLMDFTGDPAADTLEYALVAGNTIRVDKPDTFAVATLKTNGTGAWEGNRIEDNNIVLGSGVSNVRMHRIDIGTAVDSIDDNRFYYDGTNSFSAVDQGTLYTSLAAWQAAGYDAASVTAGLDSAPPGDISNLTANYNTVAHQVDLSWSAAADPAGGSGIDHYKIFRGTAANFTPAYANLIGQTDQLTFSDREELESSQTYYYKVLAEDRNGNLSAGSLSAVSVTTGAIPEPPRSWSFVEDFRTWAQGPYWYYQYSTGSGFADLTDYYAAWNVWRLGSGALVVGDGVMAPGAANSAVLTWKAPYDGSIVVSASDLIRVRDDGPGADGVRVKVLHNGTQIWPGSGWQTVEFGSPVSFPQLNVTVAEGDALSYVVDNNGSPDYDTTLWNPVIHYTSHSSPSPVPLPELPASAPQPLQVSRVDDDFEDGADPEWDPVSGVWSVVDADGSKRYRQSQTSGSGKAVIGDAGMADYTFQADVVPISLASGVVGFYIHYADDTTFYSIELADSQAVRIKKFLNGVQTVLQEQSFPLSPGTSYELKADIRKDRGTGGQRIRVYIDGLLVLNALDSSQVIPSGRAVLSTWNASAQFDNVRLNVDVLPQRLLLQSRFDDMDTTGWTFASGNWQLDTDKSMRLRQTDWSGGIAAAGSLSWTDVIAKANVKLIDAASGGGFAQLNVRHQDANNKYFAFIASTNQIALVKKEGGVQTTLASKTYPVELGKEYTLQVAAVGDVLELYVDGRKELSAADSAFASGRVALETWNADASYDDITIQSGAPTVLFSDTFDSGSMSNWTVAAGAWTIENGATKVLRSGSTTGEAVLNAGSFGDFSLEAAVKLNAAASPGGGFANLNFRRQNADNGYLVFLSDAQGIALKKNVSGVQTTLAANANIAIRPGVFYEVRVQAQGSAIDVYLNGILVLSGNDATFASGGISLSTYQATADFDDVRLTDD